MPTYRNDSGKNMNVHELLVLPPDETYETTRILNISGLTKISDDPQYNPTLQSDTVTASGEISIDSDTSTVVVINDSTTAVELFWNNTDNIPSTPIVGNSKYSFDIVDNAVNKIVLEFSGSIDAGDFRVVQMKG